VSRALRYGRLAAVLAALALATALLLKTVPLRGDISEFLPPARTPEAAFLLRELRSGTATTLLLAGIEGARPAELARISRRVAAAMTESGDFAFVANGTAELAEGEREFLFRYRYLLSPAVTPELFEAEPLRRKLAALLDGLRSSAAPLVQAFGFRDPVGAFLALLQSWVGEAHVALRDGVWMTEGPAGPRALLLGRSRAGGLDTAAQQRAAAVIRDAFAAAEPGSARLLLSGPGVFAAAAADTVRSDVRMVSVLSSVLIASYLIWRYRSLLMLAVVAVPLAAGTLAAIAVVALAFGHVHIAALGFGMTMLGVCDDYPLLLITNRAPRERLDATARRIWPPLRIAALTAIAGLTPMIASGLPGLAQLGVFAAVGLGVAAAATRWVLPHLVPQGMDVRELPSGLTRRLLRLPALRRWAVGVLALLGVALAATGGPALQRDLAALSPVPQAARALDEQLRRELGAPDVRFLLAVQAPDAEAALARSEQVAAALAPLVAAGAMGGLDHPARWLPSEAAQRRRQAALPEDAALAARLEAAREGLPFRPGAFDRFRADVAASRALPPLAPDGLAEAPTLAARLGPMLSRSGAGWQAVLLPADVRDPAALRDAVRRLPGVLFVDVKGETEAIIAADLRHAALWLGLGGVLVLLLLTLGERRRMPAARIAAALLGAPLATLAGLAALGESLTLFHLVALLLLAGIGMDYALFMARSGEASPDEAARTLGAVISCMVTTVLTFGLLALCRTPVLHAIGITVTIGVGAAFLLACTLAPRRTAA